MKTVILEMERLRNLNSGLGQYCLQLGRALAQSPEHGELRFNGYMAEHLAGILGADIPCLPVSKWHKWTGVPTDADLWHCTHQDADYFPRSKRTAVTMTIHDLNYLERTDYAGWRKALKTKRLQHKISRCKGLVYISHFVKNWVHQHLNVPDGTIEQVIYNGVKVEQAGANGGQEIPAPYIFSIGMHPKKNYEAALSILQDQPSLHWVIAGGDTKGYRAKLVQAATVLGVADQLVFAGAVSEPVKWRLYAQCEALVFPSRSEGFGLPVLEAMAFGKPVFLSQNTSLPEIGGNEAYYFETFTPEEVNTTFSKGMEQYRKDPQKAERLKAWAAQFTWEQSAAEYLDFYKTVLTKTSKT